MTVQEPRESWQKPPLTGLQAWKLVSLVLGLLVITLLITTITLRARADSAVTARQQAQALETQLQIENNELTRRNEQLFTQLSASHESLTEATRQVDVPNSLMDVSAQEVAGAVAQQQRAKGGSKALAQLRTAQICSAGSLQALASIHVGPDIESGSDDALSNLQRVLPACKAAFE